ncbi:hypothetical protein CLOP_g10657 [Closterium sp. NIES-67]|nr:hypothetical protein CLOP_g10657 [Closterium sp. NIES-67]
MAAAGLGAPMAVFSANFGSLKPRVLLIDGTCYASHAVIQRVARADRDQKLSFCCVQSEAAHPYLAAFGFNLLDVLQSPVYIQGYDSSFSGTSALLRVAWDLPLPYPLLASLLIIPRPLRDSPFHFAWRRRYCWFGQSPRVILLRPRSLIGLWTVRSWRMRGGETKIGGTMRWRRGDMGWTNPQGLWIDTLLGWAGAIPVPWGNPCALGQSLCPGAIPVPWGNPCFSRRL